MSTGPIRSSSRNVSPLFVVLFLCYFLRPLIGPQIVAGSTRQQPVRRFNQATARWQDQLGSSPLAGSSRQQNVGRINQVADRGDGDEDEDEYKDEIPSYAVLQTISVERFGVSRMRDFKNQKLFHVTCDT